MPLEFQICSRENVIPPPPNSRRWRLSWAVLQGCFSCQSQLDIFTAGNVVKMLLRRFPVCAGTKKKASSVAPVVPARTLASADVQERERLRTGGAPALPDAPLAERRGGR